MKVRIAPNEWETIFAVEGDEGDQSYSVDRLIFDPNTGMAKDKKQAQGTLARIMQYLPGGSSTFNVTDLEEDNTTLFDKIRGKDMKWTPMQGYIYVPFILEHQNAIEELQNENETSENNLALVGIERGGAMLADQLSQNTSTPVVIIEKSQDDELTGDSKKTDADNLIKEIISIADRDENIDRNITITITETVVGGGSANLIIQRINKALANRPNLTIKLLLLQQTEHSSESRESADESIKNNLDAMHMPKTEDNISGRISGIPYGQIVVCKAGTAFTLGEDVDYQLSREGEHSQKPVVLFSFNDKKLVVKRVTPQNDTKSRDIIIGLATNNLDTRILSDMK